MTGSSCGSFRVKRGATQERPETPAIRRNERLGPWASPSGGCAARWRRDFGTKAGMVSPEAGAALCLLWRIELSRRERLDQAVLRRLRKRDGNGRYWARTSDPQLVELVLSQLS